MAASLKLAFATALLCWVVGCRSGAQSGVTACRDSEGIGARPDNAMTDAAPTATVTAAATEIKRGGTQPPGSLPKSSSQEAEYAFEGLRFRLGVDEGHCQMIHRRGDNEPERLSLDLAPPCHVLLWRTPPPHLASGKAASGGVPLGNVGDPVAWRYRSAGGAAVVAIIGDPVPEDMRDHVFHERVARGYRCAGSLQGVLFRQDQVALTRKRGRVGEFCVEIGLEEKDYWMLAHQ